MRECKEIPHSDGYYDCGNGIFVDGVRCCPDSCLKTQTDYAGHPFCACLGREIDKTQMKIKFEAEKRSQKP